MHLSFVCLDALWFGWGKDLWALIKQGPDSPHVGIGLEPGSSCAQRSHGFASQRLHLCRLCEQHMCLDSLLDDDLDGALHE